MRASLATFVVALKVVSRSPSSHSQSANPPHPPISRPSHSAVTVAARNAPSPAISLREALSPVVSSLRGVPSRTPPQLEDRRLPARARRSQGITDSLRLGVHTSASRICQEPPQKVNAPRDCTKATFASRSASPFSLCAFSSLVCRTPRCQCHKRT